MAQDQQPLSAACTRFRRDFRSGAGSPHRERCRSCEAWASVLERVANAGAGLPLPDRLHRRLATIASADPGSQVVWPRGPLPQLPLPDDLRRSLDEIPHRQRRRRLPSWLAPRYAVAASYLLVLLLGASIGEPLAAGQRAAGSVGREVDEALRLATSQGRQRYAHLRMGATGRYRSARRAVESRTEQLLSLWRHTRLSFVELIPTDDPRPEARSSVPTGEDNDRSDQ